MKNCEIYSNLKTPRGSQIILRLDGRGFHTLAQQLELEKPYDKNFTKAMVQTSKEIFQEFAPQFIYTFSDEINILLKTIPFDGRIEKLNSTFASFTASSLYIKLNNKKLKKPISFDSRIIPLSQEMITPYFKTRQDEAWRNCLNGYAYWTLRKTLPQQKAVEKLNGLKSPQIHDLLFKNNILIDKIPLWQRRGIGIYKKTQTIEGYNPKTKTKTQSQRKKTHTDKKLELFTPEFFQKKDIL